MTITDEPRPASVRDLRLMYETTGRASGNVEYLNTAPDVWSSREYHNGDIIDMSLRVIPDVYSDEVVVQVERTMVTNLREDGVFSPKAVVDWSRTYSFEEFSDSPFMQMCIDVWGGSGASWDTHEMDEHEVFDNYTRWGIYAHVYEHRRSWLGSWDKTGNIEAVDVSLDENGNIELGLKRFGSHKTFYSGDIWTLERMIAEHDEMERKLGRLREHGIDLEGGALSIKLWED